MLLRLLIGSPKKKNTVRNFNIARCDGSETELSWGTLPRALWLKAERSATMETLEQKLFFDVTHYSSLGAIMASQGVIGVNGTRNGLQYGSVLAVEIPG